MAKQNSKTSAGTNQVSGAGAKKLQEQSKGQSERDPKRRKGQFTGAGDAPVMKK
jgi:hypothetical protein